MAYAGAIGASFTTVHVRSEVPGERWRTLADADEQVAARCSETADAAVAVSVHDSDAVTVSLWQAGRLVDRYEGWPGYFEGQAPTAPAVHPDAWEVLGPRGAGARLRELLAAPAQPGGAEAFLTALGKLLGWDEVVTDTAAPASAASSARGLPNLANEGGSEPEVTAPVGSRVVASAVAHNAGGPLDGLVVVVWGPALVQRLAQPDRLAVTVGDPAAQMVHTADLTPAGEGLIAQLPDVRLPAGWPSVAAALEAAGSPSDGIAAWLATRLEATCEVTLVSAGVAELHIGLLPAANPDAGQASWTVLLEPVLRESPS